MLDHWDLKILIFRQIKRKWFVRNFNFSQFLQNDSNSNSEVNFQWSHSLENLNTGSILNISWSPDSTQFVGACANGHVVHCQIIERSDTYIIIYLNICFINHLSNIVFFVKLIIIFKNGSFLFAFLQACFLA